MHPLSKDLTKLSDEELNRKINDIYKRMRFFNRTGNGPAYQQAHNLYLDYQYEFERRARVAIEEIYKDSDVDFSDKIDIG